MSASLVSAADAALLRDPKVIWRNKTSAYGHKWWVVAVDFDEDQVTYVGGRCLPNSVSVLSWLSVMEPAELGAEDEASLVTMAPMLARIATRR